MVARGDERTGAGREMVGRRRLVFPKRFVGPDGNDKYAAPIDMAALPPTQPSGMGGAL